LPQSLRVIAVFVFLGSFLLGCGQSTKNGGELRDAVKRIQETQLAFIEAVNKATIEKLDKSAARMRSAMDGKAAGEVAIGLIVEEEFDSRAALSAPPSGARQRDLAGNAQQLRDAEQAHAQAKREFLLRHPGIIEQTRARLKRGVAVEAEKELEDAVGGPNAGKK